MLKLFSFLLSMTLFTAACNSSVNQDAGMKVESTPVTGAAVNPVTTIQWVDSVKNIGKVSEGEKVEISFRFMNTGSQPLVINNVVASCGCTIAEKPEAPVAPGKEGFIKASFDSRGRIGNNRKTLTVYANTAEASYPLVFDVEVLAKR